MDKLACFRREYIVFLIILYLALAATRAAAAPEQAAKTHLYVISFNVLAPCWASPRFYSSAVAPYLPVKTRRKRIHHFLNTIRDKADIIALQETTDREFAYYQQNLNEYYSFQAFHDKNYWHNWLTPGIPWQPNGVALFVRKNTFTQVSFRDLSLTQDGNHGAYFAGVLQKTGEKVRAASIHLDSEQDGNRHLELNALMALMPKEPNTYDIIAGDFNDHTQRGVIQKILMRNHFLDTLHFLKKEAWTHPFKEDGDVRAGILDHIIVRNLTPIEGEILSSGLWKLYPDDEDQRVIANIKAYGSDHFPLYAVLKQ